MFYEYVCKYVPAYVSSPTDVPSGHVRESMAGQIFTLCPWSMPLPKRALKIPIFKGHKLLKTKTVKLKF